MKGEAHGRYRHKSEMPVHAPDFVADSVLDIDFDMLHSLGVEHIMMDLDLTVRRRHAKELEAEIISHFKKLRHRGTFKSLNLVTNNKGRLEKFSTPLGAAIFQPFKKNGRWVNKPRLTFYTHVLDKLGIEGHQAVMIGDKLSADVKGANAAGIYTVRVRPHGKDYWYDRLLLTRWREKWLLKKSRAAMAAIEALNKELQEL